ncbi:hypothetical protein TRFO_29021 [Tritrichomonas foetus]|uniref:Vacuolar sorting protein 39/Transforming growth factor beta receptor-associated zinc finger domain-containing protein n=1 Tax=Tritrichomonas foetus TaxID=1144522 RepID=A0A1J4JY20_9EUKA|nr:hypothetical protein TRFO_29021 [Tritrichomonas foetus]|eukprot:OHT03586.1 hypothetical protein TRFO_29021 [Tritrichomonas foetus]
MAQHLNNQISYHQIFDLPSLGNQIVGIVHTATQIYAVTKKRELICYPREIFTNGSTEGEKKFTDIVENNIQKFGVVFSNGKYHLLILSNNVLYLSTETSRGPTKFRPANFENTNSSPHVVNFVTISGNALLVALMQQYIIVYKYDDTQFITKDYIEFDNKKNKFTEMIGSLNHFLIHDKSKYIVYDMDLMEVDGKTLPKNLKSFHGVDRTNGFIVLTQENQLINIGERVIDNDQMSFSDELIAFHVRLPYAYGITSKKFIMQTTVGKIEETLPYKGKSTIIDVLDDYNVVLASGSTLSLIKYYLCRTPPYIPHTIKLLANLRDPTHPKYFDDWENIIKLSRRFESIAFDQTKILSEIYLDYSEHLITAQNFQRAFEMFQQSGKHPFIAIHNFRNLLYSSEEEEGPKFDFLSTANEDCIKYIALLKEAQKAIQAAIAKRNANEPFDDELEEVVKCRVNCIIHSGQKISHPTKAKAKEKLNDLLQWAEKSLDEANETSHNLSNMLFSLKPAKIIWREDGVYELQKYLIDASKNEKQPTTLKVYNTILIECFAIKIPGKLEAFIQAQNPLFFDIAAAFLKYSAPESHRLLCRLHNRDDEALGPLLEAEPVVWEGVIAYIKESNNFIEIGKRYFSHVYKMLGDKYKNLSVELFFSKTFADPKLDKGKKATMVADVISIIKEHFPGDGTKQSEQKCNQLIVKFLLYVIYQCQVKIESVHWSLITTYLSLIGSMLKDVDTNPPKARPYIRVSNEKEPMKTFRSGLINILNWSELYRTQEVLDAIMDTSERLIEERVTVLKKAMPPKTQDAIDLLSVPNFPIDVALDFCQDVYPNIDSTVYDKLLQNYQQRKRSPKGDADAEKCIKRLLNEHADKMQLRDVVSQIPPMLKINDMSEFLKISTSKSINQLRALRLKNSLLEKTIQMKREQLQQLKTGKVIVTDGLKCVICGKRIGDSVFVALGDNTVSHIACRLQSESV